MANFEYIALDAKGEESAGTITANDEADASNQLRNQGLYPTNLAPAGKGGVDSKTKARVKKAQKSRKAKGKVGGKVKG
jgi:type II secretory pathway component PulF